MISIIVPVYNSEATLDECIGSILKQKYQDFEILLVNDGSKDKSGEICDKYSENDKRIRTFHQINKGVSAARNTGLENMEGEFVTFCDSDDTVEENWLQDFIDNYNGEDILYQNIIYKYNDQRALRKKVRVNTGEGIKKNILDLYKNYALGHVVVGLLRTDIIKEHNLKFNTEYVYREDLNFVLRYLMYAKSVNIIDAANYIYNYPVSHRSYRNYNASHLKAIFEELYLIKELTKGTAGAKKDISCILYGEIITILYSVSAQLGEKEILQNLKKLRDSGLKPYNMKPRLKIFHYINIISPFLANKILVMKAKK